MRPAEFKNPEQELVRFQRRLAVAGGFVPVSYTHLTLPTSDLV